MKKIEIAIELVSVIALNNMMSHGRVYTDEEKAHMAVKAANANNKEKLEELLNAELDRKARLEAAQERERKIYNFTNSEEGRQAEAEMEAAIKAWKNDIIDEIHTIVNDVLGSKWEAYNITSTDFEVGLLDNNGSPIFGYSFPIRFGYFLRASEAGREEYFEFQANVCTMGEFEIDGNVRQEFYIGFGKFLASEKVNNELKNELKQYTDNVKGAREAYKAKKEAYIAK